MGLLVSGVLLIGGLLQIYFSGKSVLAFTYILLAIFIGIGSLPIVNKNIVKLCQSQSNIFFKWMKPILLGFTLIVIVIVSLFSKGKNLAQFENDINTAAVSIQHGDLEEAERLLEDLYERDSNNGAVNLNLGALYLSQSKPEEAKPYLDLAAKRMYHDEMLYFNYGMYFYQLEDYPNALLQFEKAVLINPSFVAANIYAATMSYEFRDLKRSIYHLENARYLMPGNPEVLLYLGKANMDLMNYSQAEENLNSALSAANSEELEELIKSELDELKSFKEGVLK